jgi:tRNA pseudouridine38-40 synthase
VCPGVAGGEAGLQAGRVSRTFKLTVAYEGTDFIGWQRQATGTSIQGLLEDALSELDGRPVAVTGAGRTDAGVHARGQVATAALDRDIDPAAVVRAVNNRLPQTVRILDASLAPEGFHARFDARLKTYRYRIWNADVMSPFERSFAWHVPMRLDMAAMNDAAGMLCGTHDFAAFQGTGSDTQTTVRTVLRSSVEREPGGAPLLVYDAAGEGFLRHMVRNVVGTLVEIGRGRFSPGWIGEVLASRDRTAAGPTAPAHGLFLMGVSYETRRP